MGRIEDTKKTKELEDALVLARENGDPELILEAMTNLCDHRYNQLFTVMIYAVEVLNWYADPSAWSTRQIDQNSRSFGPVPAIEDEGLRAREAIAKIGFLRDEQGRLS